MNREQRRKMNKSGGEMKYLNKPCSLSDASQIARGVAEEVVQDYDYNQKHIQISISLQLELIKDILIEKGIITEEEFKEKYLAKAKEFEKLQREAFESAIEKATQDEGEDNPDVGMQLTVDDIEITQKSEE